MEDLAVRIEEAFRGRRVLLTGHTGFKGGWLAIWLDMLGAEVVGVALPPDQPDGIYQASGIGGRIRDIRQDIRDGEALEACFAEHAPEVVLHLAAQALVRESYRTPAATFATNTMGTVNVLEAVRHTPSVKALVVATTDKCYENTGITSGYTESDPLGGHDPYSASKAAAEIAIASWRRSFFNVPGAPGIASARAGNVIGGGDRAEDRIVPDLFRALEAGKPLRVRAPEAVRPWQHVLEPLHGYLMLAAALLRDPVRFSGAWNLGPAPGQFHTVRDMVGAMHAHLGRGTWEPTIEQNAPHEAALLTLDSTKAAEQLGWRPRLTFDQTVRLTAEQYTTALGDQPLGQFRSWIDRYNHHADH